MNLLKEILTQFEKKLKLYFFWLTLERFPNLFRPSSKPYITGDSLRNFSDHIFDESKTLNPKKIKHNDIVFLSGNLIDIYFKYYHPKISSKYILITHNSDKNISEAETSYCDEKIIHWFAQNLECNNKENISIIPIGLENLRRLKFGRKTNFKHLEKKSNLILNSYNINSNYLKRSETKISLDNFLEFQQFSNTNDYFKILKKSMFVIAPEGNGNDTHRIWESLICNTIPIMVKTNFSINLLKLGIPGIYLDQWEQLENYTEQELTEIYDKEVIKNFQNFTQLNFWTKKIISYKLK